MTMNNRLYVIFEEGHYMFIYYVLNAFSSCPIKPVWGCLALVSAELSSLIR